MNTETESEQKPELLLRTICKTNPDQAGKLIIDLLRELARSAKPGQGLICGERYTSVGRIWQEHLAPFGISVNRTAWWFNTAGKGDRKAILKQDPDIRSKSVFTLETKPVELPEEEEQ